MNTYIFIKTVFWFTVFKFQELGQFISENYHKWGIAMVKTVVLFIMLMGVMIGIMGALILIGFVALSIIFFLFNCYPNLFDETERGLMIAQSVTAGLVIVVVSIIVKESWTGENLHKVKEFLKDNWRRASERAKGQ